MVKFFMKCFLLTTILLFGVLLGIYQANNGLMKMQGIEANTINELKEISIKAEPENNQIKETELVQQKDQTKKLEKLTSHDLQEKQQRLEEIQAFNFFSQLGVQISELFTKAFSAIFSQLTGVIDKALHSFG